MVHGNPQNGSTRYGNYLEDYWPCAGGLSAVNAIGTQFASPDTLETDLMAYSGLNKKMDAAAEIGRNSVSEVYQIQPEYYGE